jgi:hypothetical protein
MREGSILSQVNIRHKIFLFQNANFSYYAVLSHAHLSSDFPKFQLPPFFSFLILSKYWFKKTIRASKSYKA